MKKLAGIFITLLFITACLSASVFAENASCTLKIDGEPSIYLKGGNAAAELVYQSDTNYKALLFISAYKDNILSACDVKSVTITNGSNLLSTSEIDIDDEDLLKVILLEESSLRPLTAESAFSTKSDKSLIKSVFAAFASTNSKGGAITKTYSGLIDEDKKRIYINVPVSVNRDGTEEQAKTKSSDYSGAPSEDEFNADVKNLTLDIKCADGTKVITSVKNMDLSSDKEILVSGKDNTKASYTVSVSAYTVQRDIRFGASTALVTPDSSYGKIVARHGAPGPGGTYAGGGRWELAGFAYKSENGTYVRDDTNSDDQTGYVRTDDTSAYIDVSRSGTGSGKSGYIKIIKDKNGEFALSSVAGSAQSFGVEKVYSETKLAVDGISDGGFLDVCFAENRFVMRLIKDTDTALSVLFGYKTDDGSFKGGDSGVDIAVGTAYTFKCIAENSADGNVAGSLYINDDFVAAARMPFENSCRLDLSHVRYVWGADTICTASLYTWRLWYVYQVPGEVYDIYEKVAKEERDIWLWIATMYDGGGSVTYDGTVDKNNLTYDSMTHITGGDGNGFFYAPSSKANPDIFCAEIESTGQVLGNMGSVGLFKYMPQNIRDRFYQYFASRYKTGSNTPFGDGYYDTLYIDSVNARAHSRNQSNATRIKTVNSDSVTTYGTSTEAVSGVSATTPKLQTLAMYSADTVAVEMLSSSENTWTDLTAMGQATAKNMTTAIKAGPAAFRNWIENLAWNTHSWTAGDLLSNTPTYIEEYSATEEDAAKLYHEALDWLVKNQNSDGTWGQNSESDRTFGVEISGIFKVCLFLDDVPDKVLDGDSTWKAAGLSSKLRIPNAQKIYDYALYNMRNYETIKAQNPKKYGMTSTLMIRNTLDVIIDIKDYVSSGKLETDLPFIISFSYDFMSLFKTGTGEYVSSISYNSDGSIASKYSSAATGMGYNQGLGLSEPCINTCTSIIKLYTCFTQFYGIPRQKFDKEFAAEFYQIIQDELDKQTWADKYKEEYSLEKQIVSESFSDTGLKEITSSGTLPGGATLTYTKRDSSTLSIANDSILGKTTLRFTYNKTDNTSGASIQIGTPLMSYAKITAATLEFDIKVDKGFSNSGKNILFFGLENAALFSLTAKDGKLNVVTRTSSSKIGSTAYTSLNADTLYKIKLVYTPSESTKIKLYVNGSNVYGGNDFYGSDTATVAPTATKGFLMTFYKATTANVSLDNIKLNIN